MTKLKTRPALLAALRRASKRELTAGEIHKQKVSFVMGSLKENSGITRAQVEAVLSGISDHKPQ